MMDKDSSNTFRYKDFGEYVRQWRRAMQPVMTQRELADRIGVTSGFLAHVETGRSLPGLRTLLALAIELGLPLLEVLHKAGYISETLADDKALLEPELRVFFSEYWPNLTEEERELLRDFVRMLKTRVRRRRSKKQAKEGDSQTEAE